MEKLLTVQQLCKILQISRSTVYEWTHADFIPHYKFPNGVRFKESEIENWLKSKRHFGRLSKKLSVDEF